MLINDFQFHLSDPVWYNDAWIRNGQLDHVLVCPKGVFVIETKAWSNEYINERFSDGEYTPIDQVERNGYLLYKFLNGHTSSYSQIKVKQLLISADKKLPVPKGSYVTSITASYLKRYLKQRKKKLNRKKLGR